MRGWFAVRRARRAYEAQVLLSQLEQQRRINEERIASLSRPCRYCASKDDQ